MRRSIVLAVLLLVAPGAAASSQGKAPVTNRKIAPARDGNIAIQEELCAARKAGTAAAYDLFIARHPRHRLAVTARDERRALERRLRRQR